jgi:hypothetical protein
VERLAAASRSDGSPVLNSFGPNMSLARDLLEIGQTNAVIQYLESCRKFWSDDFGEIDEWLETIRSGGMPDFGANLDY